MNWPILLSDERHGPSTHKQHGSWAMCDCGTPCGQAALTRSAAGLWRRALWPLVLVSLGLGGCGPKLQPEELGQILVDWRDIPGADQYVYIPELTPPGGRYSPEEMMRRMGMPPPEGMSFEEMKKMMEEQAKSMKEKQGKHARDRISDQRGTEGEHEASTDQKPGTDAAHEQPQDPTAQPGDAGAEPASE